MRTILSLATAVALLTACQSSTASLSPRPDNPYLAAPAASAIAGDLVSRFAEQTPGASKLVRIKMDRSVFGVAMTAALKGWGYTVATNDTKDAKPIVLAYDLDRVDEQMLAHVETPSIALARGYTVTSTGAEPATPLSVIQRN